MIITADADPLLAGSDLQRHCGPGNIPARRCLLSFLSPTVVRRINDIKRLFEDMPRGLDFVGAKW
jgi:hypothetical protein